MRKQRTLNGSAFISVIFILAIILSSCATATPVIPGEIPNLEPEPQNQVDIPGGLMILPDGSGTEHPVLVFDFQIHSRLVTSGEYQECVEVGSCEPAPEAIHEYAPAGVSWNQAQSYCSYLGGRLPTEAELTRATGGEDDCPGVGDGLVVMEGFGEWVYDWDDPDYYNGSLVTNPFGPAYGDLKVAMGLDLAVINEVIWKYFGKYSDAESFAKYEDVRVFGKDIGREVSGKVEEDDGSFAKYEDAISFAKLDELKLSFAKYEGQYVIKFEDGKFYINAESVDMDKSGPGQGPDFPRMGILPDQFNPLVGFRCVTQGAALTHAPFCKTEVNAFCSLPDDKLEPLTLISAESAVDPNFNIIAASCPEGGQVDITVAHELPSGEGVEVKTSRLDCKCQELLDYPGRLYCSCPSPGEGKYLTVDVCQSGEATLLEMTDFCPDGYRYDLLAGACSLDFVAPAMVFGADADKVTACPGSTNLPVPPEGLAGFSPNTVEGIDQTALPEGGEWELFSLSDGSGMCPPGYGFNQGTGCCSPISAGNYDCATDEYFDAGLKQCLPLGFDGCGPCQEWDPALGCVALKDSDMLGGRCNVGNDEDHAVERDDPGRSIEPSAGCADGAYINETLDRCVETRDGCAIGYYLDPKSGTCRPISGPDAPCSEGYTFKPMVGCCVPSPGTGDSECPEGTGYDGLVCGPGENGCPPSHYYDDKSDSCLLRVSSECPSGTSASLIGKCIPDEPGICPEDFTFDPDTDSCYNANASQPVCNGGKVFDPALGFCRRILLRRPAIGMSGGQCDIQDLEETAMIDEGETPGSGISCYEPGIEIIPVFDFPSSTEGILRCLMLTADKTYQSGRGFCQKYPSGEGASEDFFTIDIEEGKVSSITRVSPDVIEPAEANAPPLECAYYIYGEKYDPDSDDEGKDDWSEPVSGALPPEGACTPNLFIDAGALYDPQTCTPLQITVPVCVKVSSGDSSSGSSGDSGVNCTGLNDVMCKKTTGCSWDGNQCVKDSPSNKCTGLDQVICGKTVGCHWDNVTSACIPD